MMLGVGYREELAEWIATKPVDCLEITAEHFQLRGDHPLAGLAKNFTLFVHGLGLSLGTPGKLDAARLQKFARVVQIAQPAWISEHVAFTRTAEADLGHLNPVQPTRAMARIVSEHARQISQHCGRPIILENITSHLPLRGDLSETDFLNEICAQANCGLLVDVTNLFINSRNHGFDPLAWLDQIEAQRIVQLHIVGYAMEGGRYADSHGEPIQAELLDLARAVLARAPVQAIILERDTRFPDAAAMAFEIEKLKEIHA